MKYRPKKSLGQHFLTNPAICERIISLLGAGAGDQILEIGPGPGALTEKLVALRPERLLLLEKDGRWASHWRERGCEVIAGDALAFSWAALSPNPPWHLVGNLPYNVASPLIWDIVGRCRGWSGAVFMVQKEVAQRICAAPGNGHYGALSVWVQCHAVASLEFTLAPGAFTPPPKVDSAVVRFTPAPCTPARPQELNFVLKLCFQQRRKQLGKILRPYPPLMQTLETLRISRLSRPEEVTPEHFCRLAEGFGAQECSAPSLRDIDATADNN